MSTNSADSTVSEARLPDARMQGPVRLGQYNLFTGELEAVRAGGDGDGLVGETGWLFDPDWGQRVPGRRSPRRRIQREWEKRWRKDFPDMKVNQRDVPEPPEREPGGRWEPAFKILIQPLCEKDLGSTLYAYLFVDIPRVPERMAQ